jgi:hypothetical protein
MIVLPKKIVKAIREIIPADKKNNFYYQVYIVTILISAIIKESINEKRKFVGTVKLTEYLEQNKPPPRPAKTSFTAAEYNSFKSNREGDLWNKKSSLDCKNYDYFDEKEKTMCERYLLEQQRIQEFLPPSGGKRTRNYRKRKNKNKKRKTRKTKRRN